MIWQIVHSYDLLVIAWVFGGCFQTYSYKDDAMEYLSCMTHAALVKQMPSEGLHE